MGPTALRLFRLRSLVALAALALALPACSHHRHHAAGNKASRAKPAVITSEPPASVQLCESWPVETALDHPDIADAADVWPVMIEQAQGTIDFAEFYTSDQDGSRLHQVMEALGTACERGVKVRFLVETAFLPKYPETVERLKKMKGLELRVFERFKGSGGILHAKYFIVDGRDAYLGSQNFDWRSLEHIQEMGVRLGEPSLVKALAELFAADWDVTGGASDARYQKIAWPEFPVKAEGLSLTLAASPQGFLPDEAWELPKLVKWIDEAKVSVKVQVLTYKPVSRDGAGFKELDDALRRAAERGVKVHLLVSSWSAKDSGLRSLAQVPNVEVGVLTIPKWSGGDIPFARVTHAKFFIADHDRAWVGTSNWEGDYFLKSRNVSLFVEGPLFASQLARVFDGDERSPYASRLR